MNYARVRATEKYLRNICDEVFIVSEINRCRSDPSIEEIWHKCIRNQPMRIVCTKSETVCLEFMYVYYDSGLTLHRNWMVKKL